MEERTCHQKCLHVRRNQLIPHGLARLGVFAEDHVVEQVLLVGRVIAPVLHQLVAHAAHVRDVGLELSDVRRLQQHFDPLANLAKLAARGQRVGHGLHVRVHGVRVE